MSSPSHSLDPMKLWRFAAFFAFAATISVVFLPAHGEQTKANDTIETVGDVSAGQSSYDLTSHTMTPPDNYLFIQPATHAAATPAGQAADINPNTESTAAAKWTVDQDPHSAAIFEGSLGGGLKKNPPDPPGGAAQAPPAPTWAAKVIAPRIAVECLDAGDLPKVRLKVGVCEEVKLSVAPAVFGSQINWTLVGDGQLSAYTGNSVTFTAHNRKSNPTITATSVEQHMDIDHVSFDVMEPNGAVQVKQGEYHIQNTIQTGFKAKTYLRPKEVSFSKLKVIEGIVAGVGTGCFSRWNGLMHPRWSWTQPDGTKVDAWASISSGNQQDGCEVLNSIDKVDSGDPFGGAYPQQGIPDDPQSPNDFTWPIPWNYTDSGNTLEETIATLTHHETVRNGVPLAKEITTISKSVITVQKKFTDR